MKQEEEVPEQQHGAQSDIMHDVQLPTLEEARKRYVICRNNLLAVNSWQTLAGKLSAKFTLTDPLGREVERLPLEADFIKIHLPLSLPGNYDWVRIEKIEEHEEAESNISRIIMRVRPSEPPDANAPTEHFFSSEATSSFIVERNNTRVIAMVRGRNELPNMEADGIIDKVRNAAIAVGAMIGLNSPQWKALARGIIEEQSS